MPNTNNKIEGTFTDLKENLNNHSGLTKENRKRFISGFFYDIEQYGPLLDVKRHEEGIVKDDQLAALNLLESHLQIALCLCNLERSEESGHIGIERSESVLAGMDSRSGNDIALAYTSGACDEEVLAFAHEVKREQTPHLVLMETAADAVVYSAPKDTKQKEQQDNAVKQDKPEKI